MGHHRWDSPFPHQVVVGRALVGLGTVGLALGTGLWLLSGWLPARVDGWSLAGVGAMMLVVGGWQWCTAERDGS